MIESLGRECLFFREDSQMKKKQIDAYFSPKNLCWNLHPISKSIYKSCEVQLSNWEQQCDKRGRKVRKFLGLSRHPSGEEADRLFDCLVSRQKRDQCVRNCMMNAFHLPK
eukprot:Trichotokara_eunicae@DN8975_c0_g1_i1.p1